MPGPDAPLIRRQLVYTGRVQGVGFRANSRNCARRHLVSGWVRNEPDGSVRMEIQGTAADVDAVLAEIRRTMARNITTESAVDIPVREGEQAFEIAR